MQRQRHRLLKLEVNYIEALIASINEGLRWNPIQLNTQKVSHPTYAPAQPHQKHEYSSDQKIIQKLSNWQRTQWARAGYPKGAKTLNKFATLQKVV